VTCSSSLESGRYTRIDQNKALPHVAGSKPVNFEAHLPIASFLPTVERFIGLLSGGRSMSPNGWGVVAKRLRAQMPVNLQHRWGWAWRGAIPVPAANLRPRNRPGRHERTPSLGKLAESTAADPDRQAAGVILLIRSHTCGSPRSFGAYFGNRKFSESR
jgi:hypothetical protein